MKATALYCDKCGNLAGFFPDDVIKPQPCLCPDCYTEAKIACLIEEYRCNPEDVSLPAITKEIIKLAKEGK